MRMISRIYDADIPYTAVSNQCYEAMRYNFEAVQVFPNMIGLCRHILKDSPVMVSALIAYPHGTFTAQQKAREIEECVALGATQLEVCLNCLHARSGQWEQVQEEMRAARRAAGKNRLLFVLEVEYLTQPQVQKCCKLAVGEKLDGIVTSTGLYSTVDANRQDVPIKATKQDIARIKQVVGDGLDVVAQGFIRSPEHAREMLEAGADCISSEKPIHVIGEAWEGDVAYV